MDDSKSTPRARTRAALLGGVTVAVAGLLAALALVYSNATGVSEVAAASRAQQEAESALGAASATRNAVAQVLILASTEEADPALIDAWSAQLESVTDTLADRVTAVEDDHSAPQALTETMRQITNRVGDMLLAIEEGDLDAAGAIATGALSDAFDSLTGELVEVRNTSAATIAEADLEAGSTATAARFMVAFLVPSIAVIVTFVMIRRRRRREAMEADLERERSINRSKDQLIANLSHELRTPLTGIYTTALTMEDLEFEDSELVRELNSVIIDQSADLTRMVEDLLVSAQAEAGRLAFSVDEVPITGEVDAIVAEFARLGHEVQADVEDRVVLADPGRLRQLLRNLVSNAARHGGPSIQVTGQVNESSYAIEVVDDGPGIPADLEQRLFQRFIHEGDSPLIVGSVGLGLAITKVLAEGMDGSIEYQRRNETTVFRVLLPARTATEHRGAAEAVA